MCVHALAHTMICKWSSEDNAQVLVLFHHVHSRNQIQAWQEVPLCAAPLCCPFSINSRNGEAEEEAEDYPLTSSTLFSLLALYNVLCE